MARFHKENGALVTVGLTRVPDPLEFGIVIADEDGRIQRFLEKPTWGQVFSDTVNTGVYIMEPEVLAEVSAKESVDWSHDVFPKLLAARRADLRLRLRQATGKTSARSRATSRPRRTCSTARSRSTSPGSRSRPACGSPRAPRWTRTRC